MPAHASPIADERQAIIAFLGQQHLGLRTAAYGLTDEQARSAPSASQLSIGGLLKHVRSAQASWIERVGAAPDSPQPDQRSDAERATAHQAEFQLAEDETLSDVLDAFDRANQHALEVIRQADLEAAVPVPNAPWFPKDLDAWSVRWVLFHLIEEIARHAGHADIVRESIDRATFYSLLGAVEGWPETAWLKPWRPQS
ncbi:MAG: DinB family protein [Nocardioidaceae bacterium]